MKSYEMVRKFIKKYPLTIAWRLKEHCKIIDKHLNDDEKLLYAFAGQKNDRSVDIFNTNVVALTDKRIMVATKRVVFGYFFKSITPDMYNDLTVGKGIIFGRVEIDTIKEVILITNIDPNALSEIETNITEIIIRQKKEYAKKEKKEKNQEYEVNPK